MDSRALRCGKGVLPHHPADHAPTATLGGARRHHRLRDGDLRRGADVPDEGNRGHAGSLRIAGIGADHDWPLRFRFVDHQEQKMAQVVARTLVLASLVWCTPGVVRAQSAAPNTSQAQDTSKAWVQVANSEAQRGNVSAAIEALEKAALASPANASLYARLSQAYASAGYAEAALRAIDGALALNPNEPDYVRARATLATWAGDYPAARNSYRQLQAMTPDPELALGIARVSAWSGDTNEAVKQYKRYLAGNQSNLAVWLELAKAESWRGNSGGALAAIEAYKSHGGETDRYLAETATVLASGGRPGKAVELVDG